MTGVVNADHEVDDAQDRARGLAAAGHPVLINLWIDTTDFSSGSICM